MKKTPQATSKSTAIHLGAFLCKTHTHILLEGRSAHVKNPRINSFPMTNRVCLAQKKTSSLCAVSKSLNLELRSENKHAACLNIHLAEICKNMTGRRRDFLLSSG